jgi:N-acetylmuramoyl-L-alanine amidase
MTATSFRLGFLSVSLAVSLLVPAAAQAQSARAEYAALQQREQQARQAIAEIAASSASEGSAAARDARAVIAAYETFARRHRTTGYADNALFNGASIAEALHQTLGLAADRTTALRLYRRVAAEYPTSSINRQVVTAVARLQPDPALSPESTVPAESPPSGAPEAGEIRERATLLGIERTVLEDTVRVVLVLDREVPYVEETLNGPARVFFDLKGVVAAPGLTDAVLRYPSDIVRQIRIGRHPDATVRVVLDLEGVGRHSAYAMYNPFRLVIDCEPTAAVARQSGRSGSTAVDPIPVVARSPEPPPPPTTSAVTPVLPREAPSPAGSRTRVTPPAATRDAVPARATTPVEEASAPPAAPHANGTGGFSLSRQLGLGVSRIVIDPGHGGHDPGAQVKGLNEADLTLDIALRLEKLLQAEPGIEVILTRRTDVYVRLEDRTAIANAEAADLFLSIHANASRNPATRGVETYYLSFAATPEAEAVASRENAASSGEMRQLPDIIKAIALNNKLDESRDFAAMVQESLVTRLRRSDNGVRSLGVKKAPFVVLIGASMPSVLAEVSFLTNKHDLQLLKTTAYKQRIAESLHAAVMRYRRALKGQGAIALQ